MSATSAGALVFAGSVIGLERSSFATPSRRGVLIGQIKKPEFTWPRCSPRGSGQTSSKTISLRCRKIRQRAVRRRTNCQTCSLCATIFGDRWWSRSGSNRRPEACKATALPTELRPHASTRMVGPGRLELPTLRLSGVRSNHLSYGPLWITPGCRQPAGLNAAGKTMPATLTREYVACEERETKAAKFRIFGRLDEPALVPMKTR